MDNKLLLEAKQGNIDAFEQIVIKYRSSAVRFARSIVGDSSYAEDIAQEAFAKVYLRIDEYRQGTSFKSWLFTIIRNSSIDYLRSRKNELPLDYAESICVKESTEMVLDSDERWESISLAWDKLTPDARMALYLFAVEDMKYEEVAKSIGKTVSQTKMIIYRARKKLKKEVRTA